MSHSTEYEIYSIHISKKADGPNNLLGAISSLSESTDNKLEVVDIDFDKSQIQRKDIISMKYPASKIMFSPVVSYGQDKQLIAVTSDKLRLFNYSKQKGLETRKELKNTLLKDLSAPLTSFDWSEQKNYICCSSIDTTCSIFDINTEKFYKQLIAHDKEVGSQITPDLRRVVQLEWKCLRDGGRRQHTAPVRHQGPFEVRHFARPRDRRPLHPSGVEPVGSQSNRDDFSLQLQYFYF